jgi:hypothetical protein
VHAYMWLDLAGAGEESGTEGTTLERVETRMTRAQIAQGERRGREWRERHPPAER